MNLNLLLNHLHWNEKYFINIKFYIEFDIECIGMDCIVFKLRLNYVWNVCGLRFD